ncbi:MAG: hypothetical protein P1V36_10115 [Planctomycetota bacterium]|nr:hypothetical protein [Planctomycetota bacterium]
MLRFARVPWWSACVLLLISLFAPGTADAEDPQKAPLEFQRTDYEQLIFTGTDRDIDANTADGCRREFGKPLAQPPGDMARELGADVIKSLVKAAIGSDNLGPLGSFIDAVVFFGGSPVKLGPKLNLNVGGYMKTQTEGMATITKAGVPVDVQIYSPKTNYFSRGNKILIQPDWNPLHYLELLEVEPAFYSTEVGAYTCGFDLELEVGICTPPGPDFGFGSIWPSQCWNKSVPLIPGNKSFLDLDIPVFTMCKEGYNNPASLVTGKVDGQDPNSPCGDNLLTAPVIGPLIQAATAVGATPFSIGQKPDGSLCVSTTGGLDLNAARQKRKRKKGACRQTLPEMSLCFNTATASSLSLVKENPLAAGYTPGRITFSGRKPKVVAGGLDIISLLDPVIKSATGQNCIATSIDLGPLVLDLGDLTVAYYIDQLTNFYLDSMPRIDLDVKDDPVVMAEGMDYEVVRRLTTGPVLRDGRVGAGAPGGGTIISLRADEQVYVHYPDTVTPSRGAPDFRLASTISTFAEQEDLVGLEFRLFEFSLVGWTPKPAFEEFSAPRPSKARATSGAGPNPAAACTPDAAAMAATSPARTVIQNQSEDVSDMFAPIPRRTIPVVLDPEDPIIEIKQELSEAFNEGAGSRRITYTYKLRNAGDVDLFEVQIENDLATMLGQSKTDPNSGVVDWKVLSLRVCSGLDSGNHTELTPNPLFDGRSDIRMLAPGTGPITLDGDIGQRLAIDPSTGIGETTYVVLVLRVWPGPAPRDLVGMGPWEFENVTRATARSKKRSCYIPDGTPVEHTDTSVINLGPAQLTDISQYVLYANHTLELDQASRSYGHVGSNEDIYIELGDSSILAGDMHASRKMLIDGTLGADYAFAPEIEIRPTGTLTMYGYLIDGDEVVRDRRTVVIPASVAAPVPPTDPLRVLIPPGRAMQLVAGKYDTVTVQTGGLLTFGPGTYEIDHLTVIEGARIRLDPAHGPIQINLHKALRLRKGVVMSITPFPSVTKDVRWVMPNPDADLRVETGANALGTFWVPGGKAALEPGSRLEGAIYAQDIHVAQGASFRFHSEACEGPSYLTFDQDCDKYSDCEDPAPTDPLVPPEPPPFLGPPSQPGTPKTYASPGNEPFAPGWFLIPDEGRKRAAPAGAAARPAGGAK